MKSEPVEKKVLSKVDVSKRQLVTAIRLFFNGEDEVAIHTLAAAARNVLCDLCAHHRITHPLLLDELLRDLVKPERHKEVREKFREYENYFKHANRDPDRSLTFNSEMTDFTLLEAVEAYKALTGESVPEFSAFSGWWMLRHQDLLTDAGKELTRELYGVSYSTTQRAQYFVTWMEAFRLI